MTHNVLLKIKNLASINSLSRLSTNSFQWGKRAGAKNALPLRAELFSAPQMEQHGFKLGTSHVLSAKSAPDKLIRRLSSNEDAISETCNLLIGAVQENRQITPAAEWLLDNFYLIEEQIRTAKRHFPKEYSRGLPCLKEGQSAMLPRVYDIALEIISHSDARLDAESLTLFVSAYQKAAPLQLGELWAIPIMLRLALIENLRRVAVRVAENHVNRDLADHWADQMIKTAEEDTTKLVLVIADMARSNPPMEGAFVAEFIRRLQGQGPALSLPMTWIDQRLSQSGISLEQLVYQEIQQQAADQVSVSNSIGSLRFLGKMNWSKFVEAMSLVEHAVVQDPSGTYQQMDFATRDRYRHCIERIAKHCPLSEIDVAKKAIDLASAQISTPDEDRRKTHVGYYLVDDGLQELEKEVNIELTLGMKLQRWASSAPLRTYLYAIAGITAFLGLVLATRIYTDTIDFFPAILWIIIALIGSSHLAVALVNWAVTMLAPPHLLPRMDFTKGISDDARTLLAVPTLMTSQENIDHLCEALEIRFLANRSDNLYYCLLTDFPDAAKSVMPSDESLMVYAKENIEALNRKYTTDNQDIFFLFHRPRLWNEQEKTWMGHERKRGKLGDLNAFLREGKTDAFSLIVGNTAILSGIRFVITLDTDTQMPRDTAYQLAAVMAHPLNRPYYDEQIGRVTKGYGIIQPRVSVSIPGSDASLYSQLSGGEPGIDPYTRAVSDVYQDAFKEGSFIGKGIYDLEAFERSFKDRFPPNKILSHDLLEGCYARSALLSDVQLYEEYPSRYSADVSRRHRWVRGDWQIARWIMPTVPGADGTMHKNPLSGLSRWKIFDNLRRSFVYPALLAMLLLGWSLSTSPAFWTLAVVGILVIPALTRSLLGFAFKPADMLIKPHLAASVTSMGRNIAHAAFDLLILPHEALYHLDAVLRVGWRMWISRRRLLEWNPSSMTNRSGGAGLSGAFRLMWIAPVIAIAMSVYLAIENPVALQSATIILLAWLVAPVIIWRLSLPVVHRQAKLSNEQNVFLHRLSRRTWAFFETYVGVEDNWLPPDNVQEHPVYVVAHRTSPTNIGMALLANLAAYDFGYLSAGKLLERTKNTLNTMSKLERFQGHFYNWYDTVTLAPLNPVYVSTVDSGNLAGHLLTLRPGLLELADEPVVTPKIFDGLRDTLRLIVETNAHNLPNALEDFARLIENTCDKPPATLGSFKQILEKLQHESILFLQTAALPDEMNFWAKALTRQCQEAIEEITFIAPWTERNQSAGFETIPTLREISEHGSKVSLDHTDTLLEQGITRAHERLSQIEYLAQQAEEMSHMEYGFLYDKESHLLSIGYNVTDQRLDVGYYDLLASEARLGNFVAIAQGKLPQEAWFALGRQMTIANNKPILLSWSGSMFEYLMPLLVMPNFDNTLLNQTYKASVKRQIDYGNQHNVPWGISESGYHLFDASLNYQYRAFGVPGLGLKRGLADDLVIAPYASVMALIVAPDAACANLQRLTADGFAGKFGMYEAVDYTLSRLPHGKKSATIRSFMVHHQGMSFLSLGYLLLNQPMQRRFESDPMLQSAMMLLHEKIPKATAFYSHSTELSVIRRAVTKTPEASIRVMNSSKTAIPEVQLLSNGRYHVMVTNSGGSASRWKNLAVTRWREDIARDNWGMFCYIQDVSDGRFWSASYQPTLKQPDKYEVIFSEGKAEFRRRDGDVDTHMEIVVSPEDDIELRRTRITNRSRMPKTIEITSYAEVVIAPQAADSAHPAFSNLFVQTEILKDQHAILCTRRPRTLNEQPPWMFHLMSVHGAKVEETSYETDRMKFIGRTNSLSHPQAMNNPAPLSGSEGSVLDPIVAIRQRITIEPEKSVTIDMVTGAAETRDNCVHLIDKYKDNYLAGRVSELAWTHSQVVLRQLNATDSDAQLYAKLANSVIFTNNALRAEASVLVKNRRGQSGLWSYAISGDLPIVLLQIKDIENLDLVREMIQAHAYWRLKGLSVDLVIWNEDNAGYRQLLQDQILGLIAAGIEAHMIDRPGGIFVRPGDQISPEDRILIKSVARAIITDTNGTLAEQLDRPAFKEIRIPRLMSVNGPKDAVKPQLDLPERNLLLFNGLGGFAPDGKEYVITTKPGMRTPAPWSNVLANPEFGTVISESGQSYSWGENAHSFRLTPWHNDPVQDVGGEVFYLRDEESGEFWSPTPRPSESDAPYVTRHGFGYSVFEHYENGIYTELWVYVAVDAPIKFSVLKIRNDSGRTRKLSATGYVEWVLGDLRSKAAPHIVTETDTGTGAIFARNAYNTEFAERTAFFDVDDTIRSVTGDRREFIGRNRTLCHPEAMNHARLSGKLGAGLDPCAAIQVPFELRDGQEHEIVFKLGVATGHPTIASSLVRRFRGISAARNALEAVNWHWKETLGAVKIETPDPATNLMANGWLMYQTIACRLWARSGYYQSGGAFGYRDQLQDTMALVYTKPELLRKQILLCAAHQFVEGDVQHWWHPPADHGVRTKCSDDYLWLPLATCRYLSTTGDTSILDEMVPFLEGRHLGPDEDSYYELPGRSDEIASLYEHCVRAIRRTTFGERGLPHIGSCDWNDGMDKVGEHGKGESVWLAFFLYDILQRFTKVARLRGDTAFAEHCLTDSARLQRDIEANAWDGGWYRRAYFDNGTPLGSADNLECQIDSLSQSWSVLSGAAMPERSKMGMMAVDKRLVRREHSLIQLLDPPFDKTDQNPGYIRGYVPGVRENGGQYTHAAIWTAMAFAKMGDRERTWEFLQMINPVNHGRTAEEVALYKVEPYVVAADVYGVAPHTGRGGWTWYTGSSGLMYRLIVESVLGLQLEVDKLRFQPCLPPEWDAFKLSYRYRNTIYNISVSQKAEISEIAIIVDGDKAPADFIPLIDDQEIHAVEVMLPL